MPGKMQVWVDDVELDNADDVTIDGDFGESSSADNQRFLVCNFQIEGATPTDLMRRFNELRAQFNTRSKRVQFSLDDASSQFYADIYPGDGEHSDVVTFIQPNTAHKQTGGRLRCQLVAIATMTLSGLGAGGVDGVAGLESFRLTKQFNASRVSERTFVGTFTGTFDEDANGPYSIVAVADDGSGRARFQLSAAPPAFQAGMKLKVQDTNAVYGGTHKIVSIAGALVVVESAYVSNTTTGNAWVGEATDAEDNWAAQRDYILENYLGTEADGERDATTGLALSLEEIDVADAGQTVNVLLRSTPIRRSTGLAGERSFDIRIEPEKPQWWSKAGQAGERPTLYKCAGHLELDQDQVSTPLLQIWESTIEPAIKAVVQEERGAGTIQLLTSVRRLQHQSRRLEFELIYQGGNLGVIYYKRTFQWRYDPDYVKLGGTEGYHHVQRPATPPPTFVIVTVQRVGVGKVRLDVSDPGLAGYTPVPAGTNSQEEDVSGDFGDNIWIQTTSQAYEYMKFKPGSNVRIAKVFTQSGK